MMPAKRISRATAAWLETESADWVSRGLLRAEERQRILDGYQVLSAERRSLMALTVIGALMLGIGVLLLIGYNWQRLPAAVKLVILMGSVAAAYGASAWSYQQQRRQAGETLAFIGVLLFGNAIWLVAQVLHISGNFADGFMWWAIGALTTAAAVRSRAVGIAATALVLVWTFTAVLSGDRPVLSFVAVWSAALATVYGLKSRWMLTSTVISLIVWTSTAGGRLPPETAIVGVGALTACGCYGVGAWHPPANGLGRSWQLSGLVVLLALFTPLLITGFHSDANHGPVPWLSLLAAAPPLAVTWWSAARELRRSREQDRTGLPLADGALALTAGTIAIWLGLQRIAGQAAAWGFAWTLLFSLLALVLSVALIHRSLRRNRASDLTIGVSYAVLFLLVRWVSVMDSLLWSGLMLLIASAGFFAIARLWSRRPLVAAGSRATS